MTGSAQKPLPFIVTVWIALTTALLCALWPAGLPATTTIGSAFSPATTAVALRGRAEQVRPPARRIVTAQPEALDSPPTITSPLAAPVRTASLVPPPAVWPGDAAFADRLFPAPAFSPADAFYQTGPPIA